MCIIDQMLRYVQTFHDDLNVGDKVFDGDGDCDSDCGNNGIKDVDGEVQWNYCEQGVKILWIKKQKCLGITHHCMDSLCARDVHFDVWGFVWRDVQFDFGRNGVGWHCSYIAGWRACQSGFCAAISVTSAPKTMCSTCPANVCGMHPLSAKLWRIFQNTSLHMGIWWVLSSCNQSNIFHLWLH